MFKEDSFKAIMVCQKWTCLNQLINTINKFGTPGENLPPLFDLKLVYSYLIEVADSESDLGFHGKSLVSEKWYFFE